jgi:phage-related protein
MSPTITLYAGIDDYSYADKNYISMGVDHQTWKGYLNVYGDTYIGDREHTSYMKYTPEEGLSVKGNISAASTLENSDGSQQTISDALNELSNQFNENLSAYDTALRKDIDILQNQVDGAIETWFYDDEPTLENLPAANWVDDDAKNIHLGDLYYSAQGYAYRFQLTDGVYNWVQI